MNALTQLFLNSQFFNAELSEKIAAEFKQQSFPKNEFLLKENQVSNAYYFLENGIIRSYAIDMEGNEISTNFYTAGEFVFEVQSFFLRQASKENIQTITPVNVASISFEKLNQLFHEYPQFREFGRSLLVRGFAGLKSRMLSHITTSAEERYRQLITNKPMLIEHVPLKYIATYLGITDTSLSRIRKEMR
ncbi:MAG: Crp/Fnr family transcriptional regulator [Bacteroidia bacterium]